MRDPTKYGNRLTSGNADRTHPPSLAPRGRSRIPLNRRRLLAGATAVGLGAVTTGCMSFGNSGDDDGAGSPAPSDHDHSGENGTATRLGEAAPVESITTDALYTTDQPVVNVRAYGAKGDGETDDFESIQRAFDDADHRSVIYFPPGHYRSSEAITASDKSLAIRGGGMGVTRIEFTGGTDGFDLSLPSSGRSAIGEESYVTVTDMTLGTAVSGSGTAISAVWDQPPSGAFPHLVVEHVNVRDRGNAGEDEGHFLTGIHANNAWRARVNDFHYSGHVHDIPLGDEDDIDEFEPEMIGVEFVGRCVDSSITACHFSRCDVGIKVGASGHRHTEGVRIDEATMVDTYKGIVAKSGPWLTVTSSHFNGRRTAVELDNRWEAHVSDCLFYRVQWSRTDEWAGVHAIDAHSVQVSNTNVSELSDNRTVGRAVHLENCSECVVQGNTLTGLADEGSSVVEAQESTRVMATGNIARDAPAVVRFGPSTRLSSAQGNWGPVVDDGQLNLIANNVVTERVTAQLHRNNVPEGVDATEGERGLDAGETYGQTFTVDRGFDLIETFVANFLNQDSAATMTLYRGDPETDDDLTTVNRVRQQWANMDTMGWNFGPDEGGTYYLEMSDPAETPTWWWYDVEDEDDEFADESKLAEVGGTAFINRDPVETANFWFRVIGIPDQ